MGTIKGSPTNGFVPLFSSISSYEFQQWGWTYTTCDKSQTWVNADEANTGDITLAAVGCAPPPKHHDKDCSWARQPRVNHDDQLRYLQNQRFCQTWSPGYFWYWKAHQDLMPGH